jgi:ATP-dependent RNA helicase RhlE
MLFSATMPPEIAKMARQYLVEPQRIEVAPAGTPAELVTHELYVAERYTKNELMARILARYDGSVLVFTRTRAGARRLTRQLHMQGYDAAEIHSDRSQLQRQAALSGFKSGKYRILVATDIAARGIDVKGIELVVNYDLPDNPDDYVHRIGRTGRAGQNGHAISLVLPAQGAEVRAIEKAVGTWLPLADEADLPDPVHRPRPLSEPPASVDAAAQPGTSKSARRRRRHRTHKEPEAVAPGPEAAG